MLFLALAGAIQLGQCTVCYSPYSLLSHLNPDVFSNRTQTGIWTTDFRRLRHFSVYFQLRLLHPRSRCQSRYSRLSTIHLLQRHCPGIPPRLANSNFHRFYRPQPLAPRNCLQAIRNSFRSYFGRYDWAIPCE